MFINYNNWAGCTEYFERKYLRNGDSERPEISIPFLRNKYGKSIVFIKNLNTLRHKKVRT